MKISSKFPTYPIVANAGFSVPSIGEGRLYPFLLIDTPNDSEISKLISLHKQTPPGDIWLQWGRPISPFIKKEMILQIDFKKPMEVTFGIVFNLSEQYTLLDGVIQSRGFFLQNGKKGDKINLEKDYIILEVPFMDFDKEWDGIVFNIVKSELKKSGASRKEVKKLAIQYIKSMREIWNIRREN